MPHALGPKLSSSLQDSPPDAFDPVAVVAGDSSRRTRDVVRGNASSNPGSLAAISVGWHARPRHTPHPCGFVRGDSRCVASAGARRLATYVLFRSIDGWLENLLAVATTPARPHARFLFSSNVRSPNVQAKQ